MSARPKCQAGVKVPFDLSDLIDGKEEEAEKFAKEARNIVQR